MPANVLYTKLVAGSFKEDLKKAYRQSVENPDSTSHPIEVKYGKERESDQWISLNSASRLLQKYL